MSKDLHTLKIPSHVLERCNGQQALQVIRDELLVAVAKADVLRPLVERLIVAKIAEHKHTDDRQVSYYEDIERRSGVWSFQLRDELLLALGGKSAPTHTVKGYMDFRPPHLRDQDLDTRLRKRAAELRETASIQNDRLADELEELLDNG